VSTEPLKVGDTVAVIRYGYRAKDEPTIHEGRVERVGRVWAYVSWNFGKYPQLGIRVDKRTLRRGPNEGSFAIYRSREDYELKRRAEHLWGEIRQRIHWHPEHLTVSDLETIVRILTPPEKPL
jgi:hypothetical protein